MIRFDNPAALWLLTLILPLLILYLLKRKRREVQVPSILLWKQAIEDAKANTPFQKLRSSLLLLLQILILVLVTSILSRPHFLQTSQPSSRWILVMDLSASMSAKDEQSDRFTAARNKLMDSLQNIPAADEVMLIGFSSETSILQPFTRNHSLIRNGLAELQAEDVAGNWSQLAQILQPLLREKPVPRILLASDFANFPERLTKDLKFDSLSVGTSGENVAITRAAVQALPGNPRNQVLFYEIKNYGKQNRSVDVEIRFNGDTHDAFRTTLGPMQSINRSSELKIETPTQIEIQLLPADALQTDNDFILNARPQKKIAVHPKTENPFLLRAIQVLPSVQNSVSGINIEELKPGEDPTSLPSGLYFIAGPSTSSSGKVVQWKQSHPVLRFVDAGLWNFSHHNILQVPSGAEILMETPQGCIAYAQDLPEGKKIVVGYGLEDTNMILFAGFPVFLQNSIDWLASSSQTPAVQFTGGQIKKEGPTQDRGETRYANFADPLESNITPQKISGHSSADSGTVRGKTDLSTWFLILLILIVILEWWAFHRRIEAPVQ